MVHLLERQKSLKLENEKTPDGETKTEQSADHSR